MQATASINFVTKFRLAVPIEKMEARWKQVTDIDRIHRQQSCIREGLDSLYVLRAVGAWERIFAKMEKTLSDGRPWIMGNEISLVETTHAPFIKVLDLLRLLDLWLEDRPHLQVWWDRVSARDSYKSLEEYPIVSEIDCPYPGLGIENARTNIPTRPSKAHLCRFSTLIVEHPLQHRRQFYRRKFHQLVKKSI